MNKDANQIDREALYEEVWTDPVTAVAPRYGLSDVGLAKICRKMGIPLPSRGYWAMLKAGRQMKKVPLPKLRTDQPEMASLKKLPSETVAEIAREKKKVAAIQKRFANIQVPEELLSPHPLVRQAGKRLRQRDGWSDPGELRSAPSEVLNLRVTRGSLDRALRIVDVLIKELEKQGVPVRVDEAAKQTVLDFSGTLVSFLLSERVARSNHEITPAEKRAQEQYWNRTRFGNTADYPLIPRVDFTPTGELTISAGHWPARNWRDTPRTSLNDRLGEVITGLFSLAEDIRRQAEESRIRKEKREQALDRFHWLKARRESEQERFEQIEEKAVNLERAKRLRALADEMEANALETSEGLTAAVLEDLDWIRAKAMWLDPLVEVCDPILDAPEPEPPGYW